MRLSRMWFRVRNFCLFGIAALGTTAPVLAATLPYVTSSGDYSLSANWFEGNLGDTNTEHPLLARGTTILYQAGDNFTVQGLGIGHSSIGGGSGGIGILNMTGGTLATTGNVVLDSDFSVGESRSATFNMSGGILTLSNDMVLGYWYAGATGSTNENVAANVSDSAQINISGNLQVGRFQQANGSSGAGNATFAQTGGGVALAGNLTIGSVNSAGTKVYSYHLDGGTLSVGGTLGGTANGTRQFNFNGGTLQAGTAGSTVANTLTVANVHNGGAIFDTFNGSAQTITVNQPLVHSTLDGANAVDGGLTKKNDGTLILAAANTYNGSTIVQGGTLQLASGGSIASTPLIDVHAGATFDVSPMAFSLLAGQKLQGVGTVNGGLAMAGGSVLAPGQSAGTLSFTLGGGSLDLSSISTGALEFELDTPLSSDQVLVSGGMLNVGMLNFDEFNFTALGGFGPGTYTLFDTSMAIAGSIGTAGGTIGGYSAALSIDATNNNVLLTVVPEPGSWAMLMLGSAGLWFMRRNQAKGTRV